MRAQAGGLQDQLLDLRREDVHATHDQHVVRAAGDPLHAPHGARRARQKPGEIARAIADDRQRFLGERCKHELAFVAFGHRGARCGIDDLGIEVVLPYGQAILGLDAFLRHAGPHDFREAIKVDRL